MPPRASLSSRAVKLAPLATVSLIDSTPLGSACVTPGIVDVEMYIPVIRNDAPST